MVRENVKEYLTDLHAKVQWRPTGASFRVQEEWVDFLYWIKQDAEVPTQISSNCHWVAQQGRVFECNGVGLLSTNEALVIDVGYMIDWVQQNVQRDQGSVKGQVLL